MMYALIGRETVTFTLVACNSMLQLSIKFRFWDTRLNPEKLQKRQPVW